MNSSRHSFDSIQSFAIHYGPNDFTRFSDYDLLVLEPKAYTPENIAKIKSEAKFVLAYLSVFEIDQDQPEYKHLIGHTLSVSDSSKRVFMDLRSHMSMKILYRKVENIINQDRYDGIFIDTLSYIEDCINSDSVMYSQILAICDFLKQIKQSYPDIKIVQNNGFAVVLDYTREYLDGICWENPDYTTFAIKRINKKIIKKIDLIRLENGLAVLLLTEESANKKYFKKIATRNNYLYYDAPKDYIGKAR